MEVLKKLRLDASKPVYVLNAPADVLSIFNSFEVKEKLSGNTAADQLLLFAYSSADLAAYLPTLAPFIAHHTLFWICYPKQTGRIQSDLIRMEPWRMVFDAGYRGQTSISINVDWTGIRLTNAPRKKSSIAELPLEERNEPDIDYVNRTVTLPNDAAAEVGKLPGLTEVFYALSFTNKKEAAQALNGAKKPETRQRRIQKLIEELKQKSMTKRSKK